MKKIFSQWILPLMIAIALVIVTRLYLVEIERVSDDCMQYTFRRNEKLVFLKIFNPERNNIVLLKGFPYKADAKIQRIIALPGDTIKISNSNIYINNVRLRDLKGMSYTYNFDTDSCRYASEFLLKNNIDYNKVLAKIGIYKFNADYEKIRLIEAERLFNEIKREIKDKNINFSPILSSDYLIYWNSDNLGPLLVPGQGHKIKMDNKSFRLYKHLIKEETGQVFERKDNHFFLENKQIESYIFKKDYFFLMNDNRTNSRDSREFGLVPENAIIGSFLFQLP
jgi:signal peptidase I